MEIMELVQRWRQVVAQRKELDALSKKLKEGPEAELRSQILQYLSASNVTGVKTELGMVTRTTKTHLEITDLEKFLSYQARLMLKSIHDSQPFGDSLLLQKTPHKGFITEIVSANLGVDKDTISDEQFNQEAEKFGIKRVSESDLSFKATN